MRIRFVVLSIPVGCLALLLGMGPGRTQNAAAPPADPKPATRPQPPRTPAPAPSASTDWIDERFRRLDRNGDGFLTPDEMTENLKAQLDKWDVNRDGRIDLDEWYDYVVAHNASRRRTATGRGKAPRRPARKSGRKPPTQGTARPPFDEERLARRTGQRKKATSLPKFPANLPLWFSEYDTDGDGQVSLAEWKGREDNEEEFRKYDINGDGFITLDELIVSGQYRTAKGELPPFRGNIFQAKPGVYFYIEITGTTTEQIYGTGVYTFSSGIATAVVHAGVLRPGEKGLVKVTIMPGQAQYRGSTFNGVTSHDFGAFQKSYRVQKAP